MNQQTSNHAKIINFNTLINDNILKPSRTIRPQDSSKSQSLHLKKFQEYFGRMKPTLYQQLKNIFENASFDDQETNPQLDYHIQGMTLTSRGKQVCKSKDVKVLSHTSNHFTIDSISARDVYRKAKLNKLILYQQAQGEEFVYNFSRENDQNKEDVPSRSLNQKKTTIRKSFRLSKNNPEKDSFLSYINPTHKDRFTTLDLNQILSIIHQIDIQISPNICYFNVYVQEGNNAELIKSLVRKRNGWRVVELPANANLIWTQFYRRSLLKKRLHKRLKSQNEEEKERVEYAKKLKGLSIDKRYETFKNDVTDNKGNETSFINQVRKLIPPCEIEDITKMKRNIINNLKPIQVTHNILIHNHFPFNSCISDKKNLLLNLTRYLSGLNRNVFQYVPESYQVNDLCHPKLEAFEKQDGSIKQYWIIKPGENSNRGRGINISRSISQTMEELKKRLGDQSERENIAQRRRKSVILQRYLKPLLYNGRKFDIRSYMLVTYLNNQLRMYCYEECYIRTSSRMFDIDSTSKLVHLTNDAIQSHSSEYGKFQQGNKISEAIFSRFIDEEHRKQKGGAVWGSLKEEMQERCVDVLESSYQTLLKGIKRTVSPDPNTQEDYYFQLFGMDFMIDESFKLWLIEVNTNPAITHDCSRVLNYLIPKMVDNAFAIAVQPIMRPLRLHDLPYNNQFTAVFKKTIT